MSRSFLYHIFPGFVCFVLYLAKISGERLQDHWFSGLKMTLIAKKYVDSAIQGDKNHTRQCNW